MPIRIWDTEKRKFLPALPHDKFDDLPKIVMLTDGNVYTLANNNACGDPDCCGELEYYYEPSNRYRVTYIAPEETN